MSVVYLVTVFFVTAFLLSIPLFPFWKVWAGLKTNHPDIWTAQGPFDLISLLASSARIDAFIAFVAAAKDNETLCKRDPELVKWCRMSEEVWRMLPRSFPAQVGCFFLFLYFTGVLTSLLLVPFK